MSRSASAIRPKASPDRLAHERPLWQSGVRRVAGVDEAGRGPLAGPVVAAAVILPPAWDQEGLPAALRGLNDSKQLSEARREAFYEFLMTAPGVEKGIASVEAGEIDALNILRATHRAMTLALEQLRPAPEHVLVDGLPVGAISLPQTSIVKGDSLSYSIAAASILAKVTRDRRMLLHHEEWPHYGFAIHKGYPTPAHLAALTERGPCPIHRRSFAPVRATQPGLFPP